jgi:hypothetical protein
MKELSEVFLRSKQIDCRLSRAGILILISINKPPINGTPIKLSNKSRKLTLSFKQAAKKKFIEKCRNVKALK